MNILLKLRVDNRSNSVLLTVKHEAIEDEAADKDFAVYQLRVRDDAGSLNLVYT